MVAWMSNSEPPSESGAAPLRRRVAGVCVVQLLVQVASLALVGQLCAACKGGRRSAAGSRRNRLLPLSKSPVGHTGMWSMERDRADRHAGE